MPTTIKLKNSVTTTSAPTSLAQGEVAINVTDKKVWVGNAATTPVLLLGAGSDASFTNISVSGVASFADGTVSLPSITNIGDTNTGIFFPAADTIAFTEGGVESMRITSAGDVGVGTSSPSGVLQAIKSGANLVIGDGGTSLNRFDANNNVFRTGSFVETMRIDSSGNVGIGTSSPITKLTISGSSVASGEIGTLLVTGNTTARRMAMGVDTTSTMYSWIQSVESGVAQRDLVLQPVGGNVGIGTASPTLRLSVNGDIWQGNGAGAEIGRITNNGGWYDFAGNSSNVNGTQMSHASIVRFLTASTERMRIDSSGNVMIGATSSTYRFSSSVASGADRDMLITGVSGITNGFQINYINSGTAVSYKFNSITTTASAANAFLDSADGNRLYRSTSSVRYKKDIENIEQAKSDAVLNLRPVWYRSKADNDNSDWSWYGLIAEEVAEIEPRIVHWSYLDSDYDVTEENGSIKKTLKANAKPVPDGVQYDRVSVLLLDVVKRQEQAIQEQQTLINNLTTRLNALEGK